MPDLAPPLRATTIHFEHWENCWSLSNGIVDLVVPIAFGPRIMRFGFCGGQNLFRVYDAPVPGTRIKGGHRVWAAPEVAAFTWANDTAPVQIEFEETGMRITGAVESESALEKAMTISLAPEAAEVQIVHRLTNRGSAPVTVAPWSITQMAAGGTGISAFPPRGEHPRDLLPTGSLVMWAYTDLADPKWKLLRKYWLLDQNAQYPEPQKAGLFLDPAWGAYLLGGELFIKRSTAPAGPEYPDLGCSFEMFVNSKMLELETLAGLRALAPGESAEHQERWTLHRDIHLGSLADEAIDEAIAPLL